MSRHDGRIACTPRVLAEQGRNGSRHQDAPVGATDTPVADRLGATGWPYVQYRGGSAGLLQVPDDATLGWAGDGRVARVVMDAAGQRRLEVYGRGRVQDAQDAPDLLAALAHGTGPAAVERVVTVAVAAGAAGS